MISFSVLTGSSQILLLKKIRETLAGRLQIYELWPLLMSELLYPHDAPPESPPLITAIINGQKPQEVFDSSPGVLFGHEETRLKEAEDYMLTWGGMPALLALPESRRKKWLQDYVYTYLERDLADLTRLDDLKPFATFQKLSALRSACMLNYAELARDAGVSVDTARRYIEYLKISYQCFLLQPYYKNITSTVVKTPKIFWVDPGLYRRLTGFDGTVTGRLFETWVIAEIVKWCKTVSSDAHLYYYRSRAGLEVDGLIHINGKICGLEIKSRDRLVPSDARPLKKIAAPLSSDWLGGMIVYRGNSLFKLCEPDIWAVPSHRLFGQQLHKNDIDA
jgi:hypothetical protein